MKYEIINTHEDVLQTREFLEKRSVSGREYDNINAADCRIYMHGIVWVIEHGKNVLHYETHHPAYPFFENAFHYMNVEKRAAWKTVGALTTFRQAIREATVQGTDYCEMLEEPLTLQTYKKFMRMARAHDMVHHGCHTF